MRNWIYRVPPQRHHPFRRAPIFNASRFSLPFPNEDLTALSDGILAGQNGFSGPWEFADKDPIVEISSGSFNEAIGTAGFDEVAQSFTSIDATITGFVFQLRRNGSPPDETVLLSVQGNNAGEPDGVTIRSATVEVPNTGNEAKHFSLDVPYTVTSSDVFWIVLSGVGEPQSGNFVCQSDNADPYADGNVATLDGSTWTAETGRDLKFEIHALAKYTVLTTSNRAQLHVVKTSINPPADGDWASQDAVNSPIVGTVAPIESHWSVLARADTADASSANTGLSAGFGEAAQPKVAQSFSALSGALAAFRLRIKNTSSATEDVIFSLQGDNSGDPDGVIIESRTIPNADITSSFLDFYLSLKQPLSVSTGDVYWIVLEKSGGPAVNDFSVEWDTIDSYSGGNGSFFNGSVWNGYGAGDDQDNNFSVYLADIHCFTQQSNGRVAYSVYDPGTDTWLVANELVGEIDTPSNFDIAPDDPGVSGTIRANGDVIVVWNGIQTASVTDSIFWARKVGGSWTRADFAVSGTRENVGVAVGPDSTGRIYIIATNSTATILLHTIKTDNTIDGDHSITTSSDTATLRIIPGFVENDDKSYVGYIDGDNDITVAIWDPADSPSFSQDTGVFDDTVFGHGATSPPYVAACLAVDGNTGQIVQARSSDQDMYHNSEPSDFGFTAGAETEVLDAVTVNRVSCRVGTSDLLVIYDDGGVTKYLTVSLVAGVDITVPLKTFALAVQLPAVGTGALVDTPTPKTFTLTGQDPVVGTGALVTTPTPNVFTLTGLDPTIETGVAIATPLGTFTLAGLDPTIETGVGIIVGLGTFTLTGFDPIIGIGVIVPTPMPKAFAITGFDPVINIGVNIITGLGTFTLTGFDPIIGTGIIVATPTPKVFTITGFDPTIDVGGGADTIITVPAPKAFALAGQLPTISIGVNVITGLGTFTLAGQLPIVGTGVIVVNDLGAFTLTGFDPTIETGVGIITPLGIFTLTGFDPIIGTGVIVANPLGTFTLAGQDPIIGTGLIVVTPLGTFTLTGFDPAIAIGVNVINPLGTFNLAGALPVVGTGALVATPVPNVFSITGFDPTIEAGAVDINIIVPESKAFTLTGFDPTVSIGVNVVSPLGTFTLTPFDPTIAIGVNIITPLGTFTLADLLPGINTGVNVLSPLKTFTLNNFAPTISLGVNIISPLQTFTLTGFTPILGTGIIVATPTPKTFTLTGFDPSLSFLHQIIVPNVHEFTLTALEPTILSNRPPFIGANTIDLTPPFDDITQIRYLFRNFAVIRDLLEEGADGQFTTDDGKTVLVRGGIIVHIF